MKKIFTLCACALMSMSIARAESVTVTIYDANEKEVSSYVTDLTKGTDGSYSIANFIDAGCPLSFKFDSSVASGDYTKITPTGNVYKYSSSYYYILTEAGDYSVGKIKTTDGSEIVVDTPYLNVGSTSYSYVTKVDKATYGYEYYAGITFSGYDSADNDLPDYTLEFGFDAIGGDDPVEDITTMPLGDVTVKVCTSRKGTKEKGKSFTTALSFSSNGVYTLADFLNSGSPLSFKFNSSTPVGSNSAIEFIGTAVDGSYEDILDANGDDIIAKVYNLNDDGETVIYYPYLYNTADYCYVSCLDKQESGYDYLAVLSLSGYNAESASAGWFYLLMNFNAPITTGVAVIEAADENAPVEYYNLNGQLVKDPANGIYIRKQGSKVEKVVIR